jgi:hypothetical protein
MRHDDDDGRHNNGKGQHGDMQQDELSVRGPLVFPYFFRSSNFKYPARTKKKTKKLAGNSSTRPPSQVVRTGTTKATHGELLRLDILF